MSQGSIKVIIFDLGGILVPEARETVLKKMAHRLEVPYHTFRHFAEAQKKMLRKGAMTLRAFYAMALRKFGKKDDPNALRKAHLSLYKKLSTKPDQRTLRLIKELRKRCSVVCLTNTEREIATYNRKHGLFDYFDKRYLSTEKKMDKTVPKIYRTILKDFDCKPEEAVFIDNEQQYIRIAKKLGIRTILYKNIFQLRKALVSFPILEYKEKKNFHKAVFLDRDGVITEEVEHLHRIEDIAFIPQVLDALQLLTKSSYKRIIISNQGVVGRGICTEKEFWKLHGYIAAEMEKFGIRIDGYYYCFHHPTAGKGGYLMECNCRKPNIGLLEKAAEKFKIDFSRSYMIGDKMSDILTGNRAGCKTILVKTGYGGKGGEPEMEAKPDYIKKDLLDAVSFILKRESGRRL